MAGLIGVELDPWTHETQKDPTPSSVMGPWLRGHFWPCLENVGEATLVMFSNGTGDTASWMYLDALRDWTRSGVPHVTGEDAIAVRHDRLWHPMHLDHQIQEV